MKTLRFLIQFYTKKFWRRTKPKLSESRQSHIANFPAVHLRPMHLWDYLAQFSGELALVASLACATLIAIHPHTKLELIAGATKNLSPLFKNDTQSHAQLVPEAVAYESFSPVNLTDTGDFLIRDGAIVKPNPDSVQSMVAKQIKVYDTQAGDTLSGIGAKFGLSTDTIKWNNGLTSDTIKPGWHLVVPPTDGMLHKAKANDTLPDIAKKYGVTMDSIIAYNGLDNAEDIEPGQIFVIKGGRPQAVKKPTPAPSPKSNEKQSIPDDADYGTGHEFPWGYCTYYVATKRHVPWGGNAKNWLKNAPAFGAVISKEPVVGSILVSTGGKYGHVAYVEKVTDTHVTISEMNYEAFGKIDTRTIPKRSGYVAGYILP